MINWQPQRRRRSSAWRHLAELAGLLALILLFSVAGRLFGT